MPNVIIPSDEEISMAAQASQSLANGEISYAQLPTSVIRMLEITLSELSQGRSINIQPAKNELTTFEAAAMLNVSRPYVIKLINEGKLSCRLVGQSRRIPFEEVEAYGEQQDKESYAAMAELQRMAQEDKMY